MELRIIWLGFLLPLMAICQDEGTAIDPFAPDVAARVDENQSKILSSAIELTDGTTVQPLRKWHSTHKGLAWELPAPTYFNHSFTKPTKVWEFDEGFFGTFDYGEFGGALFYGHRAANHWTRAVDSHIQQLAYFSKDRFLAAGGLAHLGHIEGAVYLIKRNNEGKWKTRKVFEAQLGVPKLHGKYSGPFNVELDDHFTMTLNSHLEISSVFAITSKGVVRYLGELKRKPANKSQ